MVRTGCGAHYTIIIKTEPQNSVGSYFGPYIKPCTLKPAFCLGFWMGLGFVVQVLACPHIGFQGFISCC